MKYPLLWAVILFTLHARATDWTTVDFDSTGTIEFPSVPQLLPQPMATVYAAQDTGCVYELVYASTRITVNASDTGVPNTSYNTCVSVLAQSMKGQVLQQNGVLVSGIMGLDALVKGLDGQTPIWIKVRMVMVNGKVYQAACTATDSSLLTAANQTRFFNSLTITTAMLAPGMQNLKNMFIEPYHRQWLRYTLPLLLSVILLTLGLYSWFKWRGRRAR